MPQICKACIHPNRDKLDAELMGGWERSLRAIAAEFGLSKDTVFRHEARHLPPEAYTPRDEPRQVREIVEQKKEPDEARQVAQVAIDKKEPAPDVEAHYSAFLDRWRGRISIRRDEMAAWEYEQTEEIEGLLDEAIRRSDLWRIGDFYGQTFKTMARLSGRA
jgi:hypothetical protein